MGVQMAEQQQQVEVVQTEAPHAWVHEDAVEVIFDRVAKANRRLAKAGVTERFALTVGERKLVERKEYGVVKARWYEKEVSLAVPSIGYNGWRFVATLSFESGGTVVRTVPGEEVGDFRPAYQGCDQCQTARDRNETYVVRQVETGEMKQVGSTCLELFFGLKPSLWIYAVDVSLSEEEQQRFGSRGIEAESVRNIVAAALAVTDGGAGYRSKAATEYGGEPTADATRACLYERPFGRGRAREEREAQLAAWRAEMAKYLEQGTEIDAVIASAADTSGSSDYAENIRVLAASEWVGLKNIGFVASFVAVHNRAIQRQVEREVKAARVQEFIGQEGDKKVRTSGTVTTKRYIDGMYGTTTLIEWLTDDGLTAKWFASNPPEVAEGDRITVTGTIKKHDTYQDKFKSTVFTRCTLVVS
jgi:hypothetical protein